MVGPSNGATLGAQVKVAMAVAIAIAIENEIEIEKKREREGRFSSRTIKLFLFSLYSASAIEMIDQIWSQRRTNTRQFSARVSNFTCSSVCVFFLSFLDCTKVI